MTMRWKSRTIIVPAYTNLGAARVVADYGNIEVSPVWSADTNYWYADTSVWNPPTPITFNLYVNKSLKFTTTLSSSDIFRMPTGYKSDTFEVEVLSSVRVRAIHLGETPLSLREV